MPLMNSPAYSKANTFHGSACIKLRFTAQCMRLLSAGYAAWVLWQILNWWLDAERLMRLAGGYLNRDLSGMATWQRMAALSLDMVAWTLLLAAVIYCWKFLGNLRNSASFSGQGAHQFMRCAWLAIACETVTLLSRPLQSYFITAHLSAAEQVFQWQFRASDLQGIILCLALLMFALVYAWALEIAEENKGFI
ncbi:MAG: hypothetical protein HHJ09_10630 [Glaciimonas sp.]|nr:hypothetical protein [Glaciimonas sp.]